MRRKEILEPELIKLCLAGSEDAWEELYRKFHNLVKKVIAWSSWGFSLQETEDLTQEVFIELVKSLDNFRHESSLSTFITRLAKNKCISQLRKKFAVKRGSAQEVLSIEEKKLDSDEPKIIVASADPPPEEALISKEDQSVLKKSLTALPVECREVIKLRYFDDKSYEEICRELNLPLGTLCSRLKRCLLRLRELYLKSAFA